MPRVVSPGPRMADSRRVAAFVPADLRFLHGPTRRLSSSPAFQGHLVSVPCVALRYHLDGSAPFSFALVDPVPARTGPFPVGAPPVGVHADAP